MNLEQLLEGRTPSRKLITTPNVANLVENYLRRRIPELMGVPGLYITGSTVWRFLYGQWPAPDADIDVMAEESVDVEGLTSSLGWKVETDLNPSVPPEDLTPGNKYRTPDGRTVDIWRKRGALTDNLRRYPQATLGHAMMAWSTKYRALVVLPNSGAQ